jgi:hypothetical protein
LIDDAALVHAVVLTPLVRVAGDGTVTYASLNHCASWRKDIPELRIDELEGVRHAISSHFTPE